LKPKPPASGRRLSCQPGPRPRPGTDWQAAWDYWVDTWQRTVLFWDVLRERSEQYYGEKTPHVLSFDAELVPDGRTFARPVNYGLVRIKPPQGLVID
jgi:hypothetical protein